MVRSLCLNRVLGLTEVSKGSLTRPFKEVQWKSLLLLRPDSRHAHVEDLPRRGCLEWLSRCFVISQLPF